MIRTTTLCILLLTGLAVLPVQAADRVLLVVSSYGDGENQTRPGYEFDELSQAYHIFRINGFAVDIASPRGGEAAADKFNKDKAYNAALLADREAMQALRNTHKIAGLRASDYRAVFVAGGKGAMFDLPSDTALQKLLAAVYRQQGVVSAVCHGPAALVEVKLDDGSYLVSGRAVSGFTDEEEQLFGKKWLAEYPFLLQNKLVERGARFEQEDIMLPQMSVDGRLITGQNPYSTTLVAEAVVRALGKAPVAREPYRDERTMQLLKRFLKGEQAWAEESLRQDTTAYDTDLLAAYGYYRLQPAQDQSAIRQALDVMELALPYIQHPRLKLAQAQAYARLHDKPRAREILQALLQQEPQMPEAQQLLQQL